MQRRMIYYPTVETDWPGAESIRLSVGNAELKIWVVRQNAREAIMYFGGNAENVAGNLPVFTELFADKALYLINYRGYGGSTGSPTETNLYRDAVHVFDHLTERHQQVSVIGRSLGSGVATYLASVRPVKKLALVTPFDSIASVARTHYPIFPVSPLVRDRFDSAARALEIAAPVLVIIAEHDEIIPRKHADQLIRAFQDKPVTKVLVPEAGHNTLDAYPEYYDALQTFLN